MLKLQSVFPYGLNNQPVDNFIKENVHVLVGFKFPALPIKTT